jgi:hypothetical protein
VSFSIEALAGGDVPERVKDALMREAGPRPRACPLSRHFVFWLVLCLPLFRAESIGAILRRLLLGLRGRVPDLPLDIVGDDAVAHARRRLGSGPLQRFFEGLGRSADRGAPFHGHRVLAIDGVHLSMPDTPENFGAFGRPSATRGSAAFPQLLVTGLLDARTRQLMDVTIAGATAPERPEAVTLLRSVQPGDLLLLDRGFLGLRLFLEIKGRRAELVCRAPRSVNLHPLRGQSHARRRGDYLAEMTLLVPLEPGDPAPPSKGTKPRTRKELKLRVRVLEYRVPGFERVRLVTTLLDAEISRTELIALYHERWDFEIANDEAKVHLSGAPIGTPPTTLRSKTPENVRQEVYALLSLHSLIRRNMAAAAAAAGLDPVKLSFVGALRILQQSSLLLSRALARQLPGFHRQMLGDLAASPIDRPRRPRRYPRVVKRKMSNFACKRPHHVALPPFDPSKVVVGTRSCG